MSRDVSSGSDCLDVRDLIKRFEELEDERDAMKEAVEEAREALSAYGTVAAEDTEEEEAVDALDEKLNEAIAARDEWNEYNGDEFKKIGGEIESMGEGSLLRLTGDCHKETPVQSDLRSGKATDKHPFVPCKHGFAPLCCECGESESSHARLPVIELGRLMDAIRTSIIAVMGAAFKDEEDAEPMRTGAALVDKYLRPLLPVGGSVYRGDSDKLMRIYSATRWMARVRKENP